MRGEVTGETAFVIEEIELLEILEEVDFTINVGAELTSTELECLKRQKHLCERKGDRTLIAIYKEDDFEVLKMCGVYRVFNNFLKQVEKICTFWQGEESKE